MFKNQKKNFQKKIKIKKLLCQIKNIKIKKIKKNYSNLIFLSLLYLLYPNQKTALITIEKAPTTI